MDFSGINIWELIVASLSTFVVGVARHSHLETRREEYADSVGRSQLR